ncbi:MAG TPA: hypothetical protein ENH13_04355 [Euryarchaeota archaeon]|nr:hypothetical protein [Euryarchaeota archaeon]
MQKPDKSGCKTPFMDFCQIHFPDKASGAKVSNLGIKAQGNGIFVKDNSALLIHPKHIRSYKKGCQRIYLAETLFGSAIQWLDEFALRFRETQTNRNPTSSSTEAPRLTQKVNDLAVQDLYTGLKHV